MLRLERIFREEKVSKILDLGCGVGRHVVYLVENGFEVYGFDFSPHAIQRAKERLEERKLSAHLIVSDMSKVFPYDSSFFDAVIAVQVIQHAMMTGVTHVISEINRTLKRGGYLYVQTPIFHLPCLILDRFANIIRRNLKCERLRPDKQWIEPRTWIPLKGPEKGVPHHGFSERELLDLLKNFNFEPRKVGAKDKCHNMRVLALKRF